MKLQYNVPIPNTFGFSVHARCLLEYDSVSELRELLGDARFASELPLPLFHIGAGSNLLIEKDFPGTILHSRIRGIEVFSENPESGEVILRVGAGENWDQLTAWAADKGLWGLENLALIPGEAGAAAVQNIGAYGVEVGEIIREVEAYDLQQQRLLTLPREACGYAYRHSHFKGQWKGRYIVTAVRLRLQRKGQPILSYGHVGEAVRKKYGSLEALTPVMLRETVSDIRRSKLPDPEQVGSAGSFFRNPFVLPETYQHVAAIAREEGLGEVPHFVLEDGLVKIPAAWLIDQCGWKGYREGNAGVWPGQPLVLVNANGQASPAEVLGLEQKIVRSVRQRFGITLQAEVEHL